MLNRETGTELRTVEYWNTDGIRQGRDFVDSLQLNERLGKRNSNVALTLRAPVLITMAGRSASSKSVAI
jgi:hypothetical protein